MTGLGSAGAASQRAVGGSAGLKSGSVPVAPRWGRFECAGPSFKFDYRQDGRALQAQVWFRSATVDPVFRAGALRILDNFR